MSTQSNGSLPAADWAAIEELFDAACDQPPGEQLAFVRSHAASPLIERQVLSLLEASRRQGVLDTELPASLAAPAGPEEIAELLQESLAERYRIDRVLGEGGMATVFLAHEIKHARAVVLKVLRPEVARWIGAERFVAEIRILARLSDPHILPLIDSGEAGGLLYYVMPFLEGETLRERITRGPIPPADAVPLLRDVAQALARAHSQGFVHRDLKPDNILVVAGHAYLMDFGVAKLKPEPGARATLAGMAIGTPAYMAPEQAAGKPVDARADLYAWGLVAREALLGRLDAQPDSRAASGIERIISRCLAVDPDSRPADGTALLAAVEAAAAGATRRGRRLPAMVAVAILALVAAAALWLLPDSGPPLEHAPAPVVVAPLRNETGDSSLTAWGRLAGDWLTQGLHEAGGIAVVPWPVSVQAAAALGADTADLLRGLASETKARTVVSGAYYLAGGTIRLQAQVTDVATGTSLATIPPVEVPRDSIGDGIRQLRERLMGAFAVRASERLATLPGIASQPPTYEAYRIFERGIERYNALDYPAAGTAFLDAWRSDTTFLTPLVYAALALLNQNQLGRVDSLVRSLRAREAKLIPHYEFQVQYFEHLLAGNGMAALEAMRRSAAEAPGGRASYYVATSALAVGRVDEALAALRTIDPDRGSMAGWSPYWFALTHALHLKGDRDGELAAARQLRQRYPDSRAGWIHETRALATVGDLRAIDSLLVEASALPPDTYWNQGAMMIIAGEELEAHGRRAQARPYYERGIDWLANQLARDPSHRAHRYWIGSAHIDRGNPADAEPYFESLAEDYPESLQFRGLYGLVAARGRDTALARRRLGPAPQYRRGDHLTFLARYAANAGDTEGAIALWSEAIGVGAGGLVWLHASGRDDLAPLASDARFQRLGILP